MDGRSSPILASADIAFVCLNPMAKMARTMTVMEMRMNKMGRGRREETLSDTDDLL